MAKRLFDIVGASVLIVALLPLFGAIATLIWLDSGRPILFSQIRIGHHGHPFRLWKFRTLRSSCGSTAHPKQYETRTGRILRRWALDELPQLWNILRGEMSLVGPRPTLLNQVVQYGRYERQRLAVRPGLTGWAQIHGRNAISWSERIDLDVWYVHHQSLSLDLRILIRTPSVLLSEEGLYGKEGNPDYQPEIEQSLPSLDRSK